MSLEEVVHALNSDLRREIINILGEKDEALTVREIYNSLEENQPTYRQSVNRALEVLKGADLVEKFYSDKKKKLVYSLKHEELRINLMNGKASYQ